MRTRSVKERRWYGTRKYVYKFWRVAWAIQLRETSGGHSISRRHHSIVIESEEASLCSPIGPDWPWHYFDRLEKAFVRPLVVPSTHTHTQKRDQVPSFPSLRVIQWISQLCIYHYDSIHLDGSLSLDDRWRANMHKHAQKGNEKRKVEEEEEEDG